MSVVSPALTNNSFHFLKLCESQTKLHLCLHQRLPQGLPPHQPANLPLPSLHQHLHLSVSWQINFHFVRLMDLTCSVSSLHKTRVPASKQEEETLPHSARITACSPQPSLFLSAIMMPLQLIWVMSRPRREWTRPGQAPDNDIYTSSKVKNMENSFVHTLSLSPRIFPYSLIILFAEDSIRRREQKKQGVPEFKCKRKSLYSIQLLCLPTFFNHFASLIYPL